MEFATTRLDAEYFQIRNGGGVVGAALTTTLVQLMLPRFLDVRKSVSVGLYDSSFALMSCKTLQKMPYDLKIYRL